MITARGNDHFNWGTAQSRRGTDFSRT